MDDFGTLARDFGFRPQGKSDPMAPSKANPGVGSDGVDRRPRSSSSFRDDQGRDGLLFNDVFGGPPKYSSANNSKSASLSSDFDYDSIFKSSSTSVSDSKNRSSSPVYDKPVYDEDFFDGLPGFKKIFASISSPRNENQNRNQSAAFDDLLGNLGRTEKSEAKNVNSSRAFDDLIPGFGGSSPPSFSSRPPSESSRPQKSSFNSTKYTSDGMEDPFVDLKSTSTPAASSPGVFTDPLEGVSKLGNSGNTKGSGSSVTGGLFDDIDPLGGFGKSTPAFSVENSGLKEGSPLRTGSSMHSAQTSTSTGTNRRSSFREPESHSQRKMSADTFEESHPITFDLPSVSTDSHKPVGQTTSPSQINAKSSEATSQVDSSGSEEQMEPSDDVWLTVSEIPLFTQPTSAPPPSRPPPPLPARAAKSEAGFFTSKAKNDYEFSSAPNTAQYSRSPKTTRPPMKSATSQIDELEDFAMGRARKNVGEYADFHSGEEVDTNSSAAASAAAMKEAMDRAEVRFRHAKEVKERECAKTARSKEAVQVEKDDQTVQDNQEREYSEKQERLEREQRQKEEEQRERRRLEKERARAREVEREREQTRQVVERATREARERAAAEAQLRAERAAVERAQSEARERAERAAVQRAQAEARKRAAAEARERAEKAAAEARERANTETKEKEDREKAAAARAEAEARRRAERAAVERAAAEARERAAAAARLNQQKNDNNIESFFSMGSRPSSVPRPRTNPSDPVLDTQFQSKGGPEGARRTSTVGTSPNMGKASSTSNIVDDLSSIFGAPSSGDFQEVEGESKERRRARLERQQRTQERATKALAEKNQRDLQTVREQEERHRIAETLDVEIKRWAAGKEGNLRALLSTLQYVLWPECGWQPVSLTDLITGASVKKVYRKATLCIHPDKVQQKGATLQQKYVSEKVFDLLKEAWNKLNSEELF